MSDSDKIKNEIEAKKRRLEELKAKRAQRAAGGAARAAGGAARAAPAAAAAAPKAAASSVLDQVNALVGGPKTAVTLTSALPLNTHTIMPQERHMYDKECQTELGVKLEGKTADMEKQLRAEQAALMQKEEKMKILMEQLKTDKAKYDQMREDERLNEPKELSAEESRRVQGSVEFQNFFGSASRMIERALNQPSYDITVNYAEDGDENNAAASSLVEARVFRSKNTDNRAVTSIDWCHKYPELVVASYAGQGDPMSFDPDGTVLVWNTHMANRPEYSFSCNSAVLSAKFHPTNPKLILGACQSGQIVIWDMREKSTPINRTSLSNGHTHPVYAMDTMSVINKLHNIVSLSTDGHLNVWSDNNLHDPSKEVRFTRGKEEITTTSFAYPKQSNSVVMGSDEGYLYKAHIYESEGIYDAVQAHKAPITNIRFHPSQKNNNLADLFLTSSFDWTVKLWSNKLNKPLYTFESARDYVFDAEWSPVHPAVFAMGDGTGRLDLWNINSAEDVPAFTAHVSSTTASGDKAAVSRVSWSDDGSNIAAGTSTGALHIYNVRDEIAQPSTEDASIFYEKVQKRLLSTSD